EDVLDVEVRTANLAIGLDGQHATEEVPILRIHLVDVFELYLTVKHRCSSAFNSGPRAVAVDVSLYRRPSQKRYMLATKDALFKSTLGFCGQASGVVCDSVAPRLSGCRPAPSPSDTSTSSAISRTGKVSETPFVAVASSNIIMQ